MPQTKPIVSIENVVASAAINQDLDLDDIQKKFPKVEYNPESFPGAVFRLTKPRTATLLFRTGKMVCTGKPIDMHYNVNNRDMKEEEYSVMFSAYSGKFAYSNVVNGTVNECVGSKMITTSFVPTVMGVYGFNAGAEGAYGISIVDYGSTPLEQHKAGVHGQDTWCKTNLILILKNDNTKPRADNYPACVTEDTATKLIERNWGFVPPESNAFEYLGGK